MRVVFDVRAIQSRHHGERGIARYVRSLAESLEVVAPDLVTDYLFDPRFPIPVSAEFAIRSGKAVRLDQLSPAVVHEGGVYLIGSPFEDAAGISDVFPPWTWERQWRSVAVLYDLIPLRFPDQYLASTHGQIHYHSRLTVLREVDRLLAISEATKLDAVELLGRRPEDITVILAGADRSFVPPTRPIPEILADLVDAERVPGLRPPYLLFTGGPDFRKNIDGLLVAYSLLDPELRDEHQLAIVCKLDDASKKRIQRRITDLGLDQSVLLTGFVEDRTLVELTQAAELVVFPSIYEGFGLPVLEARRAGAPVIAGDNSSLVEVLTDPTARFDATDPDAIAAAITNALTTPGELDRLRSLPIDDQHSWAASATTTAARVRSELTSLQESLAAAPRRRRLRMVIPQAAGTTLRPFLRSLVRELATRVDLTVISDAQPDAVLDDGERRSVEWLAPSVASPAGLSAHPTDATLYVLGGFGNRETRDRFRSMPGNVLLLSADLRSLYDIGTKTYPAALADHINDPALQINHQYPGRYGVLADGRVDVGPDASVRAGMIAAREFVTLAPQVWTLDAFTASLIRLDTGVRSAVIGPWPLPTDADVWSPRPERRPPTEEDPRSGSVVWLVDPLWSSDDDTPVKALRELALRRPEVALTIAAHRCEQLEHLRTLVAQCGLPTSVAFVEPEDAALSHASTLLSFPQRSFGGIDERILMALASGMPVVASRIGALPELAHPLIDFVPATADATQLAEALDRHIDASHSAPDRPATEEVSMIVSKLLESIYDAS